MTRQQSFDGMEPTDSRAKLEQKFIIPPFSIMDTRQGYWLDRKRVWLSLGIKSEIGRDAVAFQSQSSLNEIMGDRTRGSIKPFTMEMEDKKWQKSHNSLANITERIATGETVTETTLKIAGVGTGTSIFDPVLCELIYKWFCPEQGAILDPFAGGSVRGIIASLLGYNYYGIDLTKPQIEANIKQGKDIVPDKQPNWYVGDSHKLEDILPQDLKFDLIFTCPPYHNLERYSDDMNDLSNMSWDTFKFKYRDIIGKAILKLKPNRFACFVVSEIRDELGFYKGLVPYTIDCFRRGGMWYYNEIILVNSVGSLPVRIEGQFRYRKIGRTHQNILIFYKGDANAIPHYFKNIDTTGYNG